MTYMFLYPLLCGALVFFLLSFAAPAIAQKKEYRLFLNLHNSGIAVLTVGSLLQGVLEIAGGSFPGLWMFYAVGWAFMAVGLCFLIKMLTGKGEGFS